MLDFECGVVLAAAQESGPVRQASKFVEGTVRFDLGDDRRFLLEFRRGEILRFEPASDEPADLIVSAPADSWDKLLQAVPPPGFQDPLFNDGRSQMVLQGDFHSAVAPLYPVAQEFVLVWRSVLNGGTAMPVVMPEVDREFDAAVGRYMYIRVDGVQYRVYYEEAGEGEIPLLLQHMGGCDGRMWRHLLENPEARKMYRMIAYDLPYHGRSLPPTSRAWWGETYAPKREFFMDCVRAISERLKLDRPVFMGGSVGGMLAADLAYYHPDEFRAVVAINGSLSLEFAPEHIEKMDLMVDPKVGAHWNGTLNYSNAATTSPEVYKREICWIYNQGIPAIMRGDMDYYGFWHDLTAEQAGEIDTSKVAVYVLCSGYDFTANHARAANLAKAIPGAKFKLFPTLGHFSISENPDEYGPVLVEALRELAAEVG